LQGAQAAIPRSGRSGRVGGAASPPREGGDAADRPGRVTVSSVVACALPDSTRRAFFGQSKAPSARMKGRALPSSVCGGSLPCDSRGRPQKAAPPFRPGTDLRGVGRSDLPRLGCLETTRGGDHSRRFPHAGVPKKAAASDVPPTPSTGAPVGRRPPMNRRRGFLAGRRKSARLGDLSQAFTRFCALGSQPGTGIQLREARTCRSWE
jgi:hypothetical protein